MRYFLIFTLLLFTSGIYCQSPSKFNFQAVARNTSGNLIINQNISVRVSILSGSATGSSEYSETHSVLTDVFGVFNLLVGGGSVASGTFNAITWGSASKFLKIEADVTGGTTYQVIATTQILSVPYALYAEKAGNSPWTDGSDHIYANNVTTTSSVAVSDKGYLGIGTKNPLGEIHVNKPIGFSGTTFTGTGLNDLTVNYSNFSGTGDISYIVEVWNTGPSPDLFRWTNDGGLSWANDVQMQTGGVSLGNGLTIGFGAVDGHTYGDRWQFTASQGFMNGFIVRDGKVGISTTSPTEKLEVVGTVKATAFAGNGAGLTGIASGTGGVINTGTTTIGADTDADGVGTIALQTRGTTKILLDNNGNVGLGTLTPSVKLDVLGSINTTAPGDNTDNLLSIKGYNSILSEASFNDLQAGSPFLLLKRSRGKLSAPSVVQTDDLLGSIEAYGYDGSNFNLSSSIRFVGENAPIAGSVPARITFSTREINNMISPSERMVITGSGKVGIGKSSPTELLEVNGNIKAVSFIGNGAGLTGIASGTGGVVNTGSTTIGADSNNDGTGEIAFQTKNITRLTLSNEGNLGLGIAIPEGIFQVMDPVLVPHEGTLIFKNGNLGVGTNNPSDKLDVIGNIKSTSVEAETAIIDDVNISQALVPIGSIIPWAKSITGVPALSINFVECNGQVLNDPTSPLNGQTIPNLNGYGGTTKRFLRGSTSGGSTGGSDTNDHSHSVTIPAEDTESGAGGTDAGKQGTFGTSGPSNNNNLPSYYEVVFIIRVK